MSACEKCWADAGGNYERYLELLKQREANPCTPDQQAGKTLAQMLDDLEHEEDPRE